MSATQVPLRPLKRGSMFKLWLGIALLIAAAVALHGSVPEGCAARPPPAA